MRKPGPGSIVVDVGAVGDEDEAQALAERTSAAASLPDIGDALALVREIGAGRPPSGGHAGAASALAQLDAWIEAADALLDDAFDEPGSDLGALDAARFRLGEIRRIRDALLGRLAAVRLN